MAVEVRPDVIDPVFEIGEVLAAPWEGRQGFGVRSDRLLGGHDLGFEAADFSQLSISRSVNFLGLGGRIGRLSFVVSHQLSLPLLELFTDVLHGVWLQLPFERCNPAVQPV